jgi:superfamily II DNA helicase RecQ
MPHPSIQQSKRPIERMCVNFIVNTTHYELSLKKLHEKKTQIYADLDLPHPHIKLLYVTPELMATVSFREVLKALHARGMLARLVIDEVCALCFKQFFQK